MCDARLWGNTLIRSRKMAAGDKVKITKQFILGRLEDREADLSACGISTFPIKELVSGLGGELSNATEFLTKRIRFSKVVLAGSVHHLDHSKQGIAQRNHCCMLFLNRPMTWLLKS